MVILRATRKLLARLPATESPRTESDTALGDWYVKRFVVDRQPLLLLLSSRALLPVLVPAREVRQLPSQLPTVIAARLRRLGVDDAVIAAEVDAMAPVLTAPTVDRSVLGVMVDFAKVVPLNLEIDGWDENTLPDVEARLAQTPCYASKHSEEVVWPERDAPTLLHSRWGMLPNQRLEPTRRMIKE